MVALCELLARDSTLVRMYTKTPARLFLVVDESTHEVYCYDVGSGARVALDLVERDSVENRITVVLAHLSEFAIRAPGIKNYLPLILRYGKYIKIGKKNTIVGSLIMR